MKLNQNLAAVMLLGLAGGGLRLPTSIAHKNRLHTERARRGSKEEADRIEAAERKRRHKAAKRAAEAARVRP